MFARALVSMMRDGGAVGPCDTERDIFGESGVLSIYSRTVPQYAPCKAKSKTRPRGKGDRSGEVEECYSCPVSSV